MAAVTTTLAVGFANVGRGNVAQTQHAVDVIARRMNTLTDGSKSGDIPARPGLLFLNEVDEADQANEHGIINAALRPWDSAWWDTREPLMHTGLDVRRERSWSGAAGVARQSPTRRIHELVIDAGRDNPDLALLGGHYPAGAHNGERPAAAKAALLAGYGVMRQRHRARVHHHHRAGRHVVWAMDVNWRHFPRLHRHEGTLRHNGPDYIRVLPARGWEAVRGQDGSDALGIEPMHRLEWAVLTFRPIKHPISKETS